MNTKYEIGSECCLGLISTGWWDMRKKHGKEEQINHVRNPPGFETTEDIQRILRVLSASFLTVSCSQFRRIPGDDKVRVNYSNSMTGFSEGRHIEQ